LSPSHATNLVGTVNGTNIDFLTWVDNSTNELGFRVERSNADFQSRLGVGRCGGGGGGWLVGANVTSYLDNTVVAGSTYYYRIIVFNGLEIRWHPIRERHCGLAQRDHHHR